MNEWIFIGIFMAIAVIFPGFPMLLNVILGPKKPNPEKNSAYECGVETVGDTWVQFKVQYYLYALVFVVFDIETVFLFPWAVAYNKLPLFAVLEGIIFIVILGVALLYVWRKGVLEWS